MLLRDLVLRRGYCWPSLLLHCALHPLWGFVQVTHGEPRKSCSKVTDSCQHICQCRPPPPLPPPPPPPPPPRLLSAPAPNATSCPIEESWWSGLVIIIAVCCASLVFLTVLVIICYKAIKRLPGLLKVPPIGQTQETEEPRRHCIGVSLPGPRSKRSTVPFLPQRQDQQPPLCEDPALCRPDPHRPERASLAQEDG
ncbi:proline-rich membrane anchor 1 isoform X1 [Balaenoptera musculus]|uniref:Proline-rich membrane anchor 1 isoform X1 n=1 Tax=Balaenoptera musculus TaxID=9771 RepID=A0A8B8WTS3_BALMU|nr:proline-rich membrane anchor 1 isoform X1 [Balaenoptera musculus]XP_036700637.1 proline-rich membrane anchor 1 isoform X1 [Balaenoptera musculus]